MVDGDHRHRRVEASSSKGNSSARAWTTGAAPGRPLLDHHPRGLDGGDLKALGLVGAGAGADVDDALGVAERRLDAGGDPRVAATDRGVADAGPVVGVTGIPTRRRRARGR